MKIMKAKKKVTMIVVYKTKRKKIKRLEKRQSRLQRHLISLLLWNENNIFDIEDSTLL